MSAPFTCDDDNCPHDAACTLIAKAAEAAEDAACKAAEASQRQDRAATMRAASAATAAARSARKALPTLKACNAYTFAYSATHHAVNMAADARVLARHMRRPRSLRLATMALAAGADIGARQRAANVILAGRSKREIIDTYNEYVSDALLATARAMQAHALAEQNAFAAGASAEAAIAAGTKAGNEVIDKAAAKRKAIDEAREARLKETTTTGATAR